MTTSVLLAFAGGLLPALAWLIFWLRQDARCPEPRSLLALVFIGGGISVAVAIFLEQYAASVLTGALLITSWAIIEEVVKFAVAYGAALRTTAYDEPIDALIYLITAALGFAAVENALFLFQALDAGTVADTLLTGNFRFIGATLLHVLASATIGAAIAISYYKRRVVRTLSTIAGVFLAIMLHAVFNLLILYSSDTALLSIFAFVWIGIIGLLLIFEKAKRLKRRHARITHTRHGKK